MSYFPSLITKSQKPNSKYVLSLKDPVKVVCKFYNFEYYIVHNIQYLYIFSYHII